MTMENVMLQLAQSTAVANGYKVLTDFSPKVTKLGIWLQVTKRKNGVSGKAMLVTYEMMNTFLKEELS